VALYCEDLGLKILAKIKIYVPPYQSRITLFTLQRDTLYSVYYTLTESADFGFIPLF
jgi:hypothetical protein